MSNTRKRRAGYFTHNQWQGNKAPGINARRALKACGFPEVAGFQEAPRLKRIFGYTVYRVPEDVGTHEERANVAMAVKKRSGRTVRNVRGYAVPNGAWRWEKPKDARVWLRAVIDNDDGTVEEFWNGHRIPGGPDTGYSENQEPWNNEHRFLVEILAEKVARYPDRRFTIAADWNTFLGKNPNHPFSIENLAKDLGAKVYLRHIDGFLVIEPYSGPTSERPEQKPEKTRYTAVKLDARFGSDAHSPVVMRTETPY